MFTDLDQVKEGDLVYLYVLNKTLTYEVDKITVTTPDDTDAIQIIDGEDLLTLLTCTPYGTNTHPPACAWTSNFPRRNALHF